MLAGSGMRAAATLAASGTTIQLVSAVSSHEFDVADITAGTLDVNVDWATTRTRGVGFSYFTPLGAPLIEGAGSRLDDSINVADDVVLAFGMIEAGEVSVEARRAIVDPQRPRSLSDEDLPKVRAQETAWTLNERETRLLAGGATNVKDGALALQRRFDLDVVVTKRGPRGALVTTRDGSQVEVGAYMTRRVFPIGSGDVFAAAFAWAWGDQGRDPVAAATIASAAAAHWCETTELVTPRTILDGHTSLEQVPPDTTSKVYLAGPFFNLQQRWLIDVARDALAPGVWSPFHEVGPGGLEVAEQDLEGLRQCDSILALIDDDDPGTLFETGYAVRMQIPVVAYGESGHPEGHKMLSGTGGEHHTDLSTALYRAVWRAAQHAQGAQTTAPEPAALNVSSQHAPENPGSPSNSHGQQ